MHSACPPQMPSPPLAPRRAAPPPPGDSVADPFLPLPGPSVASASVALRPLTDAEVVAAERQRWDRLVQEGWFHRGLLHQRWDAEARRRGAAYRTRAVAARTRVRPTSTAALVLSLNLNPTLCTEETDAVSGNTASSSSTSAGTVSRVYMWRSPALLPGDALSIVNELGQQLEQQYRSLSKRPLATSHCHNPRPEDFVRALVHSRQHAGTESKIVLHYTCHGLPRPRGGSIYFLSPAGESVKVSLDSLRLRAGFPLVFIADCANAGTILHHFLKTCQKQESEDNPRFTYRHFNTSMGTSTVDTADAVTRGWCRAGAGSSADMCSMDTPSLAPTAVCVMRRGKSVSSSAARGGNGGVSPSAMPLRDDFYFIGATGEDGALPQHPWLPSDILTSCLTTPVRMALLWFIIESAATTSIHPLLLHLFSGTLDDRKTPLGQLQWAFTSITECIAWSTLPYPLFVHLFREDVVVAPLFRGFLLAERIITALGGAVSVYPPLPRTCYHPMWDTLNNIIDRAFSALQRAALPAPPAVLTSLEFREWLDWSVAAWRCAQCGPQFSTLGDRSIPMPGFLEEELRSVAVAVEGVTEQSFVRVAAGTQSPRSRAELLGYVSTAAGVEPGTATPTNTHTGITRRANSKSMGSYGGNTTNTNNSNKKSNNNPNRVANWLLSRPSTMPWEAPAPFPFFTRLPMLLQGLLVMAHRDRATELVCRLIDAGPPAVAACAEVDLFGSALVHYWKRSDLHHLLPALLFIYAKACYTDPGLAGATDVQRCAIVDAALGILARPVEVPTKTQTQMAASSPTSQGPPDTGGAPTPPLPGAWQRGTLGPFARAAGQRALAAALLSMLCVHAEKTRRRCCGAEALKICSDLLAAAAARTPVMCPSRANNTRSTEKVEGENEEGEDTEEEEEEEEEEDEGREERVGGGGGKDGEELPTTAKKKVRGKVKDDFLGEDRNDYTNNNDDDDGSEDDGWGNGSCSDGPAATYLLALTALLVTLTWDGELPGREPADDCGESSQTQKCDKKEDGNVENDTRSSRGEKDAASLLRAIIALRRLRHSKASAIRGAALKALTILLLSPSSDAVTAMRCVRAITAGQRKPYEGHPDNRLEHIGAHLVAMRWLVDELSVSMSAEEIRHALHLEFKCMHSDSRTPREKPKPPHLQHELSRQQAQEGQEPQALRVLDPHSTSESPPAALGGRPKAMIRQLALSTSYLLAAAQGSCPHIAAHAHKALVEDFLLLDVHPQPHPSGRFPCPSVIHGATVSSASRFTNFFTGFFNTFTALGAGGTGSGSAVARGKAQGRCGGGSSGNSVTGRQNAREQTRSAPLPKTACVNCALRTISVHDGSAIVSFVFTLLSFLRELMLLPLDDYDPRHPFNLERDVLLRRYLRRMREALRHTAAVMPRDSEAQDTGVLPFYPQAMSMYSSFFTLHLPQDEESSTAATAVATSTTNNLPYTNNNTNTASHTNNNTGNNNPGHQLHGNPISNPLCNTYPHGNTTRAAGRIPSPLSSPLGALPAAGGGFDGAPNSLNSAAEDPDASYQLLAERDTDAERGGRVQVLAFHPTEQHFVTGTEQGVVHVWSLETGGFDRPPPTPSKASATASAPVLRLMSQFNVGSVAAQGVSSFSPCARMRYMYAQRPTIIDSDFDSDDNSDNENDYDKEKKMHNNNSVSTDAGAEGAVGHAGDNSRSEGRNRGSLLRIWQTPGAPGPAAAGAAALLTKPHALSWPAGSAGLRRGGEPLTGLHLVDPAYRTLLCAVGRSGAVDIFAAYTDAAAVRCVTNFDTMTHEDALSSHQCLSSYHAPALLLHVSGADGSIASWDLNCEHRASAGAGRGELPAAPSVLASHPVDASTMAVGAGSVYVYDLRAPRRAVHVLPEPTAMGHAGRGGDKGAADADGSLGTCRPLCLHISFSSRYAHGLVTGYGGAQGVVMLWDDRCLRQPLRHAIFPDTHSTSSSLQAVSHLDVQCYSSGITSMAVTGDGLFMGHVMTAGGRGHFRLRHQSSAAAMHPVAPLCGIASGGRLQLYGRRRRAAVDRRAY